MLNVQHLHCILLLKNTVDRTIDVGPIAKEKVPELNTLRRSRARYLEDVGTLRHPAQWPRPFNSP